VPCTHRPLCMDSRAPSTQRPLCHEGHAHRARGHTPRPRSYGAAHNAAPYSGLTKMVKPRPHRPRLYGAAVIRRGATMDAACICLGRVRGRACASGHVTIIYYIIIIIIIIIIIFTITLCVRKCLCRGAWWLRVGVPPWVCAR
jgi:hypothetical protein